MTHCPPHGTIYCESLSISKKEYSQSTSMHVTDQEKILLTGTGKGNHGMLTIRLNGTGKCPEKTVHT